MDHGGLYDTKFFGCVSFLIFCFSSFQELSGAFDLGPTFYFCRFGNSDGENTGEVMRIEGTCILYSGLETIFPATGGQPLLLSAWPFVFLLKLFLYTIRYIIVSNALARSVVRIRGSQKYKSERALRCWLRSLLFQSAKRGRTTKRK